MGTKTTIAMMIGPIFIAVGIAIIALAALTIKKRCLRCNGPIKGTGEFCGDRCFADYEESGD